MTYLYLVKKCEGSNNFSQPHFPNMISSVMDNPNLNSSCIIDLVESETLKVEFCCGYAGVIMGIK